MASSIPECPLIGTWSKISTSPCSEIYPDDLNFQANGIYLGRRQPPGTFTVWDAGKFEPVGPDAVKISTANDAIILYFYVREGDQLTFNDAAGCLIRYQRSSSSLSSGTRPLPER